MNHNLYPQHHSFHPDHFDPSVGKGSETVKKTDSKKRFAFIIFGGGLRNGGLKNSLHRVYIGNVHRVFKTIRPVCLLGKWNQINTLFPIYPSIFNHLPIYSVIKNGNIISCYSLFFCILFIDCGNKVKLSSQTSYDIPIKKIWSSKFFFPFSHFKIYSIREIKTLQ